MVERERRIDDLYAERPELLERYEALLGKKYFDSLRRKGHDGLNKEVETPQDTATIAKTFCAVMTVIDPLRNKASYAHPTPGLLDVPEAMLAINAARAILHYMDAKLAGTV
jgi:hypothetical protein